MSLRPASESGRTESFGSRFSANTALPPRQGLRLQLVLQLAEVERLLFLRQTWRRTRTVVTHTPRTNPPLTLCHPFASRLRSQLHEHFVSIPDDISTYLAEMKEQLLQLVEWPEVSQRS